MKLLLSDATKLELEKYETGVAELNGDRTDALILHLNNIPLERVKEVFSDEDKLSVMEVYTDQNVFSDRFSGYQIRKSILIGDEDNAFTVTLVKGTETIQKVSALQQDVLSLSKDVAQALSIFGNISNQLETLPESVNAALGQVKATDNTLEIHTNAINDMVGLIKDIQDSVNRITRTEGVREEQFNEIAAKMRGIEHTSQGLAQSLSNGIEQMSTILNMSEQLKNNYVEKTARMETAAAEMQRTADAAGMTATESAKTAQAAEKANESLGQFQKTLEEHKKEVNTVAEELKTTKETITNIDERLAPLEPVTDITTLSVEEAKSFRIMESKVKLNEFLEKNPVKSACHGGKEASYSITAEKQQYLQSMILMATTAIAKGLEYQPSWNAVGEPCTYDWTVDELQQLAIEIEQVVRPNVSHQQAIEKEIASCETMEELLAVKIQYGPEPTEENQEAIMPEGGN